MRKIILQCAHERSMNGHVTAVEDDVKRLCMPMICGCAAVFAPANWTEKDADGFDMEVWKQIDSKFNEYLPPL